MLEKDKNNPTCRDCNKRLQYVDQLERRLEFSRCADPRPFSPSGSIPLLRTPLGLGGLRI
jgi:hypothetical protein